MSTRTGSAREALALFQSRYGSRPAVAASAPGRVNLIGEHIDYNGGPVFPLALKVRTTVAAAVHDGWEFTSSLEPEVVRLDPLEPMRRTWTDYLVGVIRVLRLRDAAPRGARISVTSTVPVGAGLSSSAALCVAAAKALSLLAGRRLLPIEIAEVAYHAEHDEVGVKVGRMDQTVSACARPGSALLFETATGAMELVPMTAKVWIVESGVTHRLTGGDYNQRRRECEEALAILREHRFDIQALAQVPVARLPEALSRLPPSLVKRVRHVVTETARTRLAAGLLGRKDLVSFGKILVEGHESLQVDYQSTVEEADFLVSTAMKFGAYGARLTGGGWGGAVIMLLPPEREQRIIAEIGSTFEKQYGRVPATWWSRASSGVKREPVT
jgi:galactokinase